MDLTLSLKDALPDDGTAGTLVGRAWDGMTKYDLSEVGRKLEGVRPLFVDSTIAGRTVQG